MGIKIHVPEVRISYPHLFAAHKVNPADPKGKYSASLLIPANAPVVSEIAAAIQQTTQENFPNPPANLRQPPWKQGDQDGHPGCILLRASSAQKPITVDQNVQPIIDQAMVYAGCFVNAHISVFAYQTPTPGITFGLDGVQFLRDGERLDGRPTAEQMFQRVPGAPPPAAGAMPAGFSPAPAAAPGPGPAPAAPGPAPGVPGNGTDFMD